MLRRLFAILSIVSLLACLSLVALRVRSAVSSDVWMIPTARDEAVLFSSQMGGFCEVTHVSHWPSPRMARWSGAGWRNVGPFIIWAIHRESQYGGVWMREGTVMVPLASRGGEVAYDQSYKRAEALGFPNTMSPPPESAIVTGWQLKIPHAYCIGAAAILPVLYGIYVIRKLRAVLTHRLRRGLRLCTVCGYDLRASAGRCPECGTPIPDAPRPAPLGSAG